MNPYARFNFGHAGALIGRYSNEALDTALENFPDPYKGMHPLQYLEGIIKDLIIKNKINNPVSDKNLEKANEVAETLKGLLGNDGI